MWRVNRTKSSLNDSNGLGILVSNPEKLPYLQTFKDRHGHVRHYYRRRGYPRVALPSTDSALFHASYAIAGKCAHPPLGDGRPTWVYFLRAEGLGLIKIGKSTHVKSRMKDLQGGSPDRITLLATVLDPSGWTLERILHKKFDADRSHGEWFFPSEGLLAFIAALPIAT